MKYLFVLAFSVVPFFAAASIQGDACKTKENLRNKMNIISSNIANINTTRTPEGGPYREKKFICVDQKCEVREISKVLTVYEPHHPDANENGYVSYPDINLMQEMESMIQANRDFEKATKICK